MQLVVSTRAIMRSEEAVVVGGLLLSLNVVDCNLCLKVIIALWWKTPIAFLFSIMVYKANHLCVEHIHMYDCIWLLYKEIGFFITKKYFMS